MAAIYGGNRKPSVIATAVMIERLGRVLCARTREGIRAGRMRTGQKKEKIEGRAEELLRGMGTSVCAHVCVCRGIYPGISRRPLHQVPLLRVPSSHRSFFFYQQTFRNERRPCAFCRSFRQLPPDNQHKSRRSFIEHLIQRGPIETP